MTYRSDHPVEEPELCHGNEGGEAPGDLVECLAWPPALAAQLQLSRPAVHLQVFPEQPHC